MENAQDKSVEMHKGMRVIEGHDILRLLAGSLTESSWYYMSVLTGREVAGTKKQQPVLPPTMLLVASYRTSAWPVG